ncbi:MAG: hypothetical protein ACXAEU_22355 [Candidatus Hodarchaeales archaeon]|jgi:hypothetical protein
MQEKAEKSKNTFSDQKYDSLENYIISLDQKIDSLHERMNEIHEKLNYLLASSVISTSRNVAFTPDFQNFIMDKIGDISEMEVMAVLGSHTLGVVVSYFDEEHGPVPLIVIPDGLKESPNLLINLVDLSFNNCQVLNDFDDESSASFELLLGGGFFVNCLAFGFSLNRSRARGGAENITLSILINNDVFTLVNQFTKRVKEKVHEIHVLMDKHEDDKDKLMLALLDLRKLISFIVLSYNRTYSYSKMKDF